MATAALVAPLPKLRFVDGNGAALSGGKLFIYNGGTTSKATVYTDSTAATPTSNPIILDSRGECNCWLLANTNYKFVLSPSTDTDPPTNSFWTQDNVSSNLPATSIIPCTATGTNTIALTPVSGSVTSYTDQQQFSFYAAATSTGNVTVNVQSVGAKNLYLPDGVTQVGAGALITGRFYMAEYSAAANSNAGGFVLIVSPTNTDAGPSVAGMARNLSGSAAGGTKTASWTVDELVAETALGGLAYKGASLSLSFNGATTGAGGMDTGATPTSADLFIYAIFNPGTATWSTLGTTSGAGATIYGGANMPSGYTASALIWAGKTDGSAFILKFGQRDRAISIATTVALNNGTANTPTSISLSSIVPINAKSVDGWLQVVAPNTDAAGTLESFYVSSDNTTSPMGAQICGFQPGAAATQPWEMVNSMNNLLLITAQTIWYFFSSRTGGTANVSISRYTI